MKNCRLGSLPVGARFRFASTGTNHPSHGIFGEVLEVHTHEIIVRLRKEPWQAGHNIRRSGSIQGWSREMRVEPLP